MNSDFELTANAMPTAPGRVRDVIRHARLPGMRERAKSFGGKLEVWSQQGAGTEIELTVPAAIAYGGSEARRRFWFHERRLKEQMSTSPN